MPQTTLLDLLQRAPSRTPLSEEEQAYADALAEREQAALRARRTEAQPGLSDAVWRAVYGTADVVEPAIGSLADLVTGATVGADPSARTQPIWEQRPSMQELGEIVSTAVMPMGSPLRKAAYRASMLKRPVRIQWMANKEGGQSIGNQEEIGQITNTVFNKFIRPLTKIKTFGEYQKHYPNSYVSLVRNPLGDIGGGTTNFDWRVTKVGSLEDLLPAQQSKHWSKTVKSFDDPESIKWGQQSDTEVFGQLPEETGIGGITWMPPPGKSPLTNAQMQEVKRRLGESPMFSDVTGERLYDFTDIENLKTAMIEESYDDIFELLETWFPSSE